MGSEHGVVTLKSCPFCGEEARFERRGTSRQSCIVRCTWCGASHESSDEYERSGCSWNDRAPPSRLAAIRSDRLRVARWMGRQRRSAATLRASAESERLYIMQRAVSGAVSGVLSDLLNDLRATLRNEEAPDGQ